MGYKQKKRTRTDENLKEDVIDSLFKNYFVDSTHIEVFVEKGVVTLSGFVGSKEEVKEAHRCAQNLTGVLEVINNLQIHTPKEKPLSKTGFETGFS
ncbi:MAG: BON domain-containing protein [Bacteriovoracaceae bacterium]